MRIGAHVEPTDPLAEAAARNAEVVQFFLADPQGWKTPAPRADAQALKDSDLLVFIHAPYIVNVASPNNRIRIPSRKLMQVHAEAAATVGANGLIVHGGHVDKGDVEEGFASWRKALQQHRDTGVPILIENTAGGDNACARRFDALARLWDAVGDLNVGFCLDTCHAHAGGEDLVDIVERVKAITGRIDLVHANGSKDGFDSGRDRHDNLFGGGAPGTLDAKLVAAVVAAAGAPVVVETPGGAEGQAADIAYLRAHL
jgi:deoxyribonuclease IV